LIAPFLDEWCDAVKLEDGVLGNGYWDIGQFIHYFLNSQYPIPNFLVVI